MARLRVKTFQDLSEARSCFLGEVDECAEDLRRKHVTAFPGQAMAYEAKYQEALAGAGPHIESEADALGLPVAEVADRVLAARRKWNTVSAAIEKARVTAKARIRSAESASEMQWIARKAQDQLNRLTPD